MKTTDKKLCVAKDGQGYDVYRVIYTDGSRFFVKWNKKIIDVTEDVKARRYTYR